MTEADTCRKYVVPKLQAAGWEDEPHSIEEQRTFTDGRIIPHGNTARRRPGKRADYILRYTRDIMLAVVEAKSISETAGREGDIGRGHMQTFQDVETATPAILTTSQLLSTGLDAPTCKNVVIARFKDFYMLPE